MKKLKYLFTFLVCNIPFMAVNAYTKVSCGGITGIPKKIPELSVWGFRLIQVAVPVILVIIGMIDFIKSITSQKEDEIKKGQKVFVKRLVVAFIIFFVVAIAKFLVSVATNSADASNIVKCIECFTVNVNKCR